MEQSNNILKVNFSLSNRHVIVESIEKFKRQYRLNFDILIDEEEKNVQINLDELSENDSFMMGYYYGAFEFIENNKNRNKES